MFNPAPVFVMGSFVVACSAKVARLPQPGESLAASAFVLEPGGKGFNLAVGVRRLGLEVDGLLAVGNDSFADFAAGALDRADLSPAMLVRFPGATGAGIGFVDAGGENCLAVYPGANARLSAADATLAATRIAGARLLLAQFEIGDAPIECAFALARKAGIATLLNPSPYREIRPEILANTGILVVNRVEAACLAAQLGLAAPLDEALPRLAGILFGEGLEALIVTLGAQGALLFENHRPAFLQPAFPADAGDTLGAGDAFIAGFATAFIEGLSRAQCTRWGAAAGALCTTRPGVFDALPTRGALENLLQSGA